MTFPNRSKVTYEEGIFVGYRWFDEKDIEPLFAFGHGLSYTTFEYGEAKLDKKSMAENGSVKLTVKVTNTGKREGAEVVQLYISDKESSLPRPEKVLKDFQKVRLAPGQSVDVTFTIGVDKLKFYDPSIADWKAEKGDFEALVGGGSDDIRTRVAFTLK
jgi:beta-glucosidase